MNNEIKIKTIGQLLNYVETVEKAEELIDHITNLQEELKSANESITWWTNRFKAVQKENKGLKERCEKAIEDINKLISGCYIEEKGDAVEWYSIRSCCNMRLEIIKKDLLGEDK